MSKKSKARLTSSAALRSSSSTSAGSGDLEWPSISAKEDLVLETFEPDQILLLPGFLDPLECKRFSTFLETQPLVGTPAAKKGEADRVNDRISIQSPAFSRILWEALKFYVEGIPSFQTHLFPPAKASSFNPNIRLYRYTEGQYFGPHYDDSIKDLKSGSWSEWTLLVYLTGEEDGVEGGQTVFFKPRSKRVVDELVPPLARGTALLHR